MASHQRKPRYHETLPIYKKARELTVLVLGLPKDMRKDARPLIGRELLRESLAIMRLVRTVNMARDGAKVPHLGLLLEKVQLIQDLVTVCDDTHLISPKQYADVIAVTENLGQQAGALKRTYARA